MTMVCAKSGNARSARAQRDYTPGIARFASPLVVPCNFAHIYIFKEVRVCGILFQNITQNRGAFMTMALYDGLDGLDLKCP